MPTELVLAGPISSPLGVSGCPCSLAALEDVSSSGTCSAVDPRPTMMGPRSASISTMASSFWFSSFTMAPSVSSLSKPSLAERLERRDAREPFERFDSRDCLDPIERLDPMERLDPRDRRGTGEAWL